MGTMSETNGGTRSLAGRAVDLVFWSVMGVAVVGGVALALLMEAAF